MSKNRTKALLAIAFASGVANFELPITLANETSSTSITESFVESTKLTPEYRAHFLLCLASTIISGENVASATPRFKLLAEKPRPIDFLWKPSQRDELLMSFVEKKTIAANTPKSPLSAEQNSVAKDAIEKALNQAPAMSDKNCQQVTIYVASQMFSRLNNASEQQRCLDDLERTFKTCEIAPHPDEATIAASCSILNAMAYSIVPVSILNVAPLPVPPSNISDADFMRSERLKLRAVAIADRLDAKNHVRRKAHRDMSLWYSQLSKTDEAEKQKRILFKLVGVENDGLLYPQRGMCGSFAWWRLDQTPIAGDCGMG